MKKIISQGIKIYNKNLFQIFLEITSEDTKNHLIYLKISILKHFCHLDTDSIILCILDFLFILFHFLFDCLDL